MSQHVVIDQWKKLVSADYKKYLTFFVQLMKTQKRTDIKKLHDDAFEKIHCLDCANCCKTTPALLTAADISRISSHLGMSKKEFSRKFVLEDVNGELSLNKVPCHFLREDNTCSIYEWRPQACRGFPHTDDSSFYKRPVLNAKNVMVCPAAFFVAERLKSMTDSFPGNENERFD